jgi:hypothetical protein
MRDGKKMMDTTPRALPRPDEKAKIPGDTQDEILITSILAQPRTVAAGRSRSPATAPRAATLDICCSP